MQRFVWSWPTEQTGFRCVTAPFRRERPSAPGRSWCRRGLLAAAVSSLIVCGARVPAQDSPAAAIPHAASAAGGDAQERLSVLVLRSGRVVQGEVLPQAGGYRVRLPQGEMVVPYELTLVAAASLQDAYEKRRDAMNSPDVLDHMDLARWCLSHRLYDPCIEQLRAALRLQPDYEPARRMLRRVLAVTNPRLLTSETAPPPRPASRTITGFAVPPRQTLAGLPAETAGAFVRRIQPLLLNRCGNARCHGANRGSFRLTHRRSGRVTTERNLTAVLRHVDFEQPERSRLLQRARAPHGDLQTSPGVLLNDEHWEALRDWVYAVAGAQRAASGPVATDGANARSAAVTAFPVERPSARSGAASSSPLERSDSRRAEEGDDAVDGGGGKLVEGGIGAADDDRESVELSRERELLELLRGKTPDDPFSPEIFN